MISLASFCAIFLFPLQPMQDVPEKPVQEAAQEVELPDGPLTLQFGVYRTDKATTMYRTFLPVIEGIQTAMEKELGRSVEIELKIYKTYEEGLNSLIKGDVDFVRFGPASYILAKRQNKDLRLLAMEHKKGKKRFKGVIAVDARSPFQTLADLKGHSFAFGDKNSTIGRYLAQAELVSAGLTSSDLGEYKFLGRHDLVAKSIEIGDFDAGSLKISTFEKMNKDGKLRVLHSFDNVTKPWIASSKLNPRIVLALKNVMLRWTDPKPLAVLKISGWLETKDEEYAFVRKGMALAEKEF